jgi:hypothetical protein
VFKSIIIGWKKDLKHYTGGGGRGGEYSTTTYIHQSYAHSHNIYIRKTTTRIDLFLPMPPSKIYISSNFTKTDKKTNIPKYAYDSYMYYGYPPATRGKNPYHVKTLDNFIYNQKIPAITL